MVKLLVEVQRISLKNVKHRLQFSQCEFKKELLSEIIGEGPQDLGVLSSSVCHHLLKRMSVSKISGFLRATRAPNNQKSRYKNDLCLVFFDISFRVFAAFSEK